MENQGNQVRSPSWWQIVLIGRRPKLTLIRAVVLVAATLAVFTFILLPVHIEGSSMEPTYHERGVNCINRLAYLWHEPRRGDVVGIRFSGHSIMYMKRIVGVPGETVEFRQGRLFVDGNVLDEPYVKYGGRWNRPPVTLGPNEYFVVGDNRAMRMSDHKHGRVERERIIGKVLL